MFVPPYNALLKALGTTPAELEAREEITIPVGLLKYLLKIAVEKAAFNERGYLTSNPDIAQALRLGQIESARDHYVDHGYFECRRGATPDVDEGWYKKLNPDVAAAIRARSVTSALEHYQAAGVEEFRAPNEAYAEECEAWKKALSRMS